MAENVVGQLQEVGIRRNHADVLPLLGGVEGDYFLELPAVIQAGHGILLRKGFQNILLLLLQKVLVLQGADDGFQVQVLAPQLGEMFRQKAQGVQDIFKPGVGDGGDGVDAAQIFLLVQLQGPGNSAVVLFAVIIFHQPYLAHDHVRHVDAVNHNIDPRIREPCRLAVADIGGRIFVGTQGQHGLVTPCTSYGRFFDHIPAESAVIAVLGEALTPESPDPQAHLQGGGKRIHELLQGVRVKYIVKSICIHCYPPLLLSVVHSARGCRGVLRSDYAAP